MKTYSEQLIEMSKSDRDELQSRLARIMEHLLKVGHLHHLLSQNERLWVGTIRRERQETVRVLDRHPGLKHLLTQEFVNQAYRESLAAVKPEFPETTFPGCCPYAVAEVLGREVMQSLGKTR